MAFSKNELCKIFFRVIRRYQHYHKILLIVTRELIKLGGKGHACVVLLVRLLGKGLHTWIVTIIIKPHVLTVVDYDLTVTSSRPDDERRSKPRSHTPICARFATKSVLRNQTIGNISVRLQLFVVDDRDAFAWVVDHRETPRIMCSYIMHRAALLLIPFITHGN